MITCYLPWLASAQLWQGQNDATVITLLKEEDTAALKSGAAKKVPSSQLARAPLALEHPWRRRTTAAMCAAKGCIKTSWWQQATRRFTKIASGTLNNVSPSALVLLVLQFSCDQGFFLGGDNSTLHTHTHTHTHSPHTLKCKH